jgi:hypothetical protein
MKNILFHIAYYSILFFLVEGRITPSSKESDEAPTLVSRISRKRNQIKSKQLDPQIYDEFGSNFFDEDNIAWSRILGETTSFNHEHCEVEVDLEVTCYLSDDPSISCIDYMDKIGYDISMDCEVPVIYEYVVTNIGAATDRITKIKAAINRERPFTYIGNSVSWPNRLLEPDQHLTATQLSSLNFCEFYNQDINFEVGIECTEGDAKMFYPKISFENRPASCNAKLDLSCETSDGGPCLPVQQSSSTECDFRPYYFDFFFSGGLCAASDNNQRSKFWCREKGDVTEVSTAFVIVQGKKNQIYFSGYVNKSETFTVGLGYKVDSQMWVYIYDSHGGTVLQAFSFHSSCSKSLALDDIFGAITIAGFRDDTRNVSSKTFDPPQYKFTYKVSNNGQQSIVLRNIVYFTDTNEDAAIFDVGRGDIYVSPHGSLSRSNFLALNETSSSCLGIKARLKYLTLPSHNSKVCYAQARYNSPTSSKGKGKKKGKGNSSSRSNCVAKGKGKKSSKGKGKSPKGKGKNKSYKGKGKKSSKGKGKSPKGKGEGKKRSSKGKTSKGKGKKYGKRD